MIERKREGGEESGEKTSRKALKQARVGVKEHQTEGCKDRERG